MIDNNYELINQTIYDLLIQTGYEVHYISPSANAVLPYLAFSYEEGEEYLYNLKIETWIDNIDLVGLDKILADVKKVLDKKIIFDNKFSYRFYYNSKADVMEVEGSNFIGRDIIFEMKIV